MALDSLDLKLLSLVQANNRYTSEQLADAVGLSPTACQRRLKQLRENRVIEADVSVVSPKGIGREMMMLVSVSLERERADIIDRFKQAIRNTPEIMMGFYVTGDTDFVLLVTAKSMDDYEAFTRKFFYRFQDIKSFKTTVVMDRVKIGLALPLDQE
jgi:Lrp/AsnC family leucine-responsive transcriptional regulator